MQGLFYRQYFGIVFPLLIFSSALVAAPPLTLDDQLAKVAEKSPAFGGLYFDENGDLNVYLTNPKAKGQVQASIRSVFGQQLINAHPSVSKRFIGKNTISPDDFIVRKGKYSIKNLQRWKKQASQAFAFEETIFIDLDESRNRITIGLSDLNQKQSITNALINANIPSEALNFVESETPVLLSHTLNSVFRPTMAGIRISYDHPEGGFGTCTMGFNALLNGVIGYVTNSHCSQVRGGTDYTINYQPSASNFGIVGYEYYDPPFFSSPWYWECPWFKSCRYSDAAFVRYYSFVDSDRGSIARTRSWNTGTLSVDHTNSMLTIIQEQAMTVSGTIIDKIGAGTGWTYGTVVGTCGDYNAPGNIVYKCQDVVQRSGAIAGRGDSGSPAFVYFGNSVSLAGIVYAGLNENSDGTFNTFIFSPIRFVRSELGNLTTF